MAISKIESAGLGAGTVLQVVQYVLSGVNGTSTSSSTFIDTGLSASITPKFATSKILVQVNQGGCGKTGGNTGVNYRLYRNGSQIQVILDAGFYNGSATVDNRFGIISTTYLDSPATTSSVTYKTQFANFTSGTGLAYVQDFGNTQIASTITLTEIAA